MIELCHISGYSVEQRDGLAPTPQRTPIIAIGAALIPSMNPNIPPSIQLMCIVADAKEGLKVQLGKVSKDSNLSC